MYVSSFPDSSACKESCNAEDLGLIPGSGRSPGARIGPPFQYSWASLVVQMVKNPPSMWETPVWFLGQEDSSGGGCGNPLQCSCLENPHGQRSLVGYAPWGRKELDMTEWLSTCASVFLETSIRVSTNLFIPSKLSIHKIPSVSCTNLFDHWPIWKWGQDKENSIAWHCCPPCRVTWGC